MKARQLGISTGVHVLALDHAIWKKNQYIGIIDKNLNDAKKKLDRIRYTYDNIPEKVREKLPKIVERNKERISFDNGSVIEVGTSHRGGTLNFLWISEFADICKRAPEKAKEIMTGALNTVQAGQIVIIESTANGADGYFYDMCQRALPDGNKSNKERSKLDYRFYFFPWFDQEEYRIDCPKDYVFSEETAKYFEKLSHQEINLDDDQKYWYSKKKELLGEEVWQEYPSTPKEAFMASDKDKYYADLILRAKAENRVCELPSNSHLEVDIFQDLGRNDLNPIGFFQTVGEEEWCIDYLETEGFHVTQDIAATKMRIKEKGYVIGTVYLPHDAENRVKQAEKTTADYWREAGFTIKIVPKSGIDFGISEVKMLLKRMKFNKSTTEQLIKWLSKYRKKWNENQGRYTVPVHDEASHAADMMRYKAVTKKKLAEDQEAEYYDFGADFDYFSQYDR